jgi:hypothetical protein
LAVDSDFREHKDGFNDENIGRNIFNKSYHITMSNPSNADTDGCRIEDDISVTAKLFFKGGKTSKIQGVLDAALDTGHNYKLKASNFNDFPSVIKRVVGNSVVPSPLDTNDNSIIITVEFTVLSIFSVI